MGKKTDSRMSTCNHTVVRGMRIIHLPSPTNVAYCGIAIDAGARDETSDEYGIAHMCEHMLFKGTARRTATHVIRRMEAVGGDLNAYTNKEETVVYTAFMKEHLDRAIDLLCDIVFCSYYYNVEMVKEREVVVDEIESYNDSPAELIFDRFENIIYEGCDLSHDILGKAEDVRLFDSTHAKRFAHKHYHPDNMVMFVMGDYDFSKVVRIASRRLDEYIPASAHCTDVNGETTSTHNADYTLAPYKPSVSTIDIGSHQAHVMIGCRGYSSKDDRRIALYFLNNILGGPGMSSRLNMALRERHGLVYTVESTLTNYTDTSTFAVYFGCDPEDVDQCLALVREEFDKLIAQPLTQREMNAAMKQIKGQLGVACDNFESYILDVAKCYLHYNKYEGLEDTFCHLDRLTPELIQQVAADILNKDNLTSHIMK